MTRRAHKRAFLAFMAGESITDAARQYDLDPCDLERFIRAVGLWGRAAYRAWIK